MKRMYRVHTPAGIRSYNDEETALTLFLGCKIDGDPSAEQTILESCGDAVAVRYGGVETIKIFGRSGLDLFAGMIAETNRTVIVESKMKENRQTIYFVKVLTPQEVKS